MPDVPSERGSAAALRGEAVRSITQALSAQQPLRRVLAAIAEAGRTATRARSTAVGLRSGSGALLDLVAVAADNAEEVTGLRIRVDDSLAESALRTGHASMHGAQAVGSLAAGDEAGSSGAPAAVVPIQWRGETLGALLALNRAGDPPFDQEDVATLRLLSDLAGIAADLSAKQQRCAEQARELGVLYSAVQSISASLNVQEILDAVLETACASVSHRAAVVFLLNDERTHLFVAAERGLLDEERDVQLAAGGPMAARVLDGEPILYTDATAEPDLECLRGGAQVRCAMVAPIRSRHDTLGLIAVTSLEPSAYSANDLQLVAAVGSQAGIAISNAYLYEDATRRAEEAAALYELSQHVSGTLDLSRVLQLVADSAVELLKADGLALMLMDPRESRLKTHVSRGVDPVRFSAIQPAAGEGIAGWVYEWSTPTAAADVPADARNRSAPIDQEGVASALCVPVAAGDETLGVLLALSSRRRLFTVAEMELLYTIANQAAAAVSSATLFQAARLRSARTRRCFHRVARGLGEASGERDVPQLLADLALGLMRADRCAIYAWDGEIARLRAASGFRATTPPDPCLPNGESLAGQVIRRGRPLVLETLADDPRASAYTWLARERLASYVAVPVKAARKTVGAVEIYTQDPRVFAEDEVRLLREFIQRARLAERLVPASG